MMKANLKEEELIVIDFGNETMKVAYKDDLETKTFEIGSSVEKNSLDRSHVVRLSGEIDDMCFGVGTPLIIRNKSKRKHLAESILLCVHAAYGPGDHAIRMSCGLPLGIYKEEKENFQSTIMQLGPIEGLVNGQYMSVQIKSVLVNPEGVAAQMYLQSYVPKKPILLMDIGGGTIDVVALDYTGTKWVVKGKADIFGGGMRCLSILKSSLLKLTGKALETTDIAAYIKLKEPIKDIHDKELAIESLYAKELEDYHEEVFSEIAVNIPSIWDREIICIGNGSLFFKDNSVSSVTIFEEEQQRVYANALGYWMLLINSLKKK